MIGPCYWLDETSGVLRPVVEKYLNCTTPELTPEECAVMRAYLRQWIEPDVWGESDYLVALRDMIPILTTEAAIDAWSRAALAVEIDPF